MKTLKQIIFEAAMSPPSAVKAACKRGLELKGDHGGGGLTSAAVAWAKKLAAGQPISPEKARKMHAFFARHKVDKKPHWDSPPTPGYVAWQLWGGDAGKTWAAKIVKQLDKEDDK